MVKKKVTVMIQARTDSSRLPKKVLAKIENKPMIWHVINRAKKIQNVEQVILITTRKKSDKKLQDIAKQNGIICFRGDTNDVLNRHYICAIKYNADPIIRITSDCPLIDPKIVKKILNFYRTHNYDYVSNTIVPTYPDGLDTEIFSFASLEKAAILARKKSEREHVTPFIKNNPQKFKIYNFRNSRDLSQYRWTVDEKEDLYFVRKIYSKLRPKKIFSMHEIIKIIYKNPKLAEINKNITRDEGYKKSLSKDKIMK